MCLVTMDLYLGYLWMIMVHMSYTHAVSNIVIYFFLQNIEMKYIKKSIEEGNGSVRYFISELDRGM